MAATRPVQSGAVLGVPSRPVPTLCRHSRRHLRRDLRVECQAGPAAVREAQTEATVSPPATSPVRKTARSPQDLKDPAKIGAKGTASVPVPLYPGPVTLSSYMTLPVEQYYLLDANQIRHLEGNRFLLLVPRINILNVWIEPEVEIAVSTVTAADGTQKVVLQAEHCKIKGCDLIERLKLDQRFCMRFTTELTWDDAPVQQQPAAPQSPQGNSTPASGSFSLNLGSLGSWSGSRLDSWSSATWDDGVQVPPCAAGTIVGNATLEVWCEVIPPFNFMPREALQGTCNAVMSGVVNTLLPMFLRNLGADWVKWAAAPAYRAERARRSKPLA